MNEIASQKTPWKRGGNENAKSATEDQLIFCSPAKRIMPIEFNLPEAEIIVVLE
jgi:hypothetical protein